MNGTLTEHPEWFRTLNAHRIEAAWRLGSWTSLEKFLGDDYEPRFEASIGALLHAIARGNGDTFVQKLSELKIDLARTVASSITGTYAQGYEGILKLHMLDDVECFHNALSEQRGGLQGAMRTFHARLDTTIPSHSVQEPILDLRRAILAAV